jgi:hypothetical protein
VGIAVGHYVKLRCLKSILSKRRYDEIGGVWAGEIMAWEGRGFGL